MFSYISLFFVIVLFLGFLVLLIYLGIKSQFMKVSTGTEGLIGKNAIAITRIDEKGGKIFIHGEIWYAVSDTTIKKGESVIVRKADDMEIFVEPKKLNRRFD